MPCPDAQGEEGPLVLKAQEFLKESTSRLRVLLESEGNLPDVKVAFVKHFCSYGLLVMSYSLVDMLLGAQQRPAFNICLQSSECPRGVDRSANCNSVKERPVFH